MSSLAADYVVMVVFGILLGVILKLYASIAGIDRATDSGHARRSLRERIADSFNPEKLRAENEARLKSMPRSAWIAMIFLYGLVAMLILVVNVSPVMMRWWPFLGSLFGAHIIAGIVFSRTVAASRAPR